MHELSRLEEDVLRLATDGGYPDSAVLRGQLSGIRSVRRIVTTFGFNLDLEVDRTSVARATATANAAIHGVTATVDSLEHGAGFVIFVEDGYLARLEAFSYDEAWPEHITGYTVALSETGAPTVIPRVR
jgi:hypothetical protein